MLIYSPKTINILSRRFYYHHPGLEDREYITEELNFENTGDKEIKEIILEIDAFRDNLRIVDKNNINIVYLPRDEILKRGIPTLNEISPDMVDRVKHGKIYILWIILNEPLLPGQQQILFMKYVKQQPTRGIQVNKGKLGIFLNETVTSQLVFYDKETITVNGSWAEGLSIEKFAIFIAMGKNKRKEIFPIPLPQSNIPNNQDTMIQQLADTIRFVINNESHFFQYAISQNLDVEDSIDVKDGIDYIFQTYYIRPEKTETYLIFSLLMITLFFPFTEILFLVFHLNSFSNLFDVTKVEAILILTTGFAQLRTKFINYKIWITGALILMGIIFVIGLVYLL